MRVSGVATVVIVQLITMFTIKPIKVICQDITDNNGITAVIGPGISGLHGLVDTFNEADPFNPNPVKFFYYNSVLGKNTRVEIVNGEEEKMKNYWLKGQPLEILIHGWLANSTNGLLNIVRPAYLSNGNFNVIIMDYRKVADEIILPIPEYLAPRMGKILATLLENLVNLGVVNISEIHLVGHSLGAHVAGMCGTVFSLGKIPRITGLDPAAPGFETLTIQTQHLNRNDAHFVDVIHTDKGRSGFVASIGHADFFPNGGAAIQPGCERYTSNTLQEDFIIFCSHFKSQYYYTDSLYFRKSLIAKKCSSWEEYQSGACRNNPESPMGYDANQNARGNYYLRTSDHSPYAIPDNN